MECRRRRKGHGGVGHGGKDAAHGSGTPVKQNKDGHENAFALLNIKPHSFGFSEWRGS